jgi:hypothetical protein
MELKILHQETVQNTAQIIDAIRSLDIYPLSWVEQKLKECKKRFKKEYTRNTQYIHPIHRYDEGSIPILARAKDDVFISSPVAPLQPHASTAPPPRPHRHEPTLLRS